MFPANIVPGQGFAEFTVYEQSNGVSASGRPVSTGYSKTDKEFFGMLVGASQSEIDQWKQQGHPITHKIIEYSAERKAEATDMLKLEHQNRQFYVKGVKNPANLNVTMVYYVEERLDIKKELE